MAASAARRAAGALRAYALGLPGASEEFPWGERVVKVKKKVFVFLGSAEGAQGLSLSVKLPTSHLAALSLPFTAPTGYGLGKSGWVSARFTASEEPPVDLLTLWIEESYRAVAPKQMVAALDGAAPTAAKKAATKKKSTKKATTKKATTKKKSTKKAATKKPAARRAR